MPIIVKLNILYFWASLLSPNLLPLISKSYKEYIGLSEFLIPIILFINSFYLLFQFKNKGLCALGSKNEIRVLISLIVFNVYFIIMSSINGVLIHYTMLLRNFLSFLLCLQLIYIFRYLMNISISIENIYISNIQIIGLLVLIIGILEWFFPDVVRSLYQYKESARGFRFNMIRIGSSIVNANVFGSLVVLFFINSSVNFRYRSLFVNFMIIILSIIDIILSGSKGAMLGMFMVFLLFIYNKGTNVLQKIVLIVFIAIFFMIGIILSVYFYHLNDIKLLSTGNYIASIGKIFLPSWINILPNSVIERFFLTYVYLKAYFHNLDIVRLFLGGIDQNIIKTILLSKNIYYGPHNSFVYILCTSGMVGLFLFLRMLFYVLKLSKKYSDDSKMCQVIFLWTIALVVQSFFDSLLGINSKLSQIWLFILPVIFVSGNFLDRSFK